MQVESERVYETQSLVPYRRLSKASGKERTTEKDATVREWEPVLSRSHVIYILYTLLPQLNFYVREESVTTWATPPTCFVIEHNALSSLETTDQCMEVFFTFCTLLTVSWRGYLWATAVTPGLWDAKVLSHCELLSHCAKASTDKCWSKGR